MAIQLAMWMSIILWKIVKKWWYQKVQSHVQLHSITCIISTTSQCRSFWNSKKCKKKMGTLWRFRWIGQFSICVDFLMIFQFHSIFLHMPSKRISSNMPYYFDKKMTIYNIKLSATFGLKMGYCVTKIPSI